MRVLFLESHPLWIHGLPNGFRDAGHEIKISGPLHDEDFIYQLILEFKPDLVMTMGWSEESGIDKQRWIYRAVKRTHVPHAFWATEDPTCTQSFTIPYINRVRPDFIFTICPEMVDFYRQKGLPAAHLDFGYHASVHHPVPQQDPYCQVAVVANAYPHALEVYPELERIHSIHTLIRPLLMAGIRVDFWGLEWNKMSQLLGCEIPHEWLHGYISYTEASRIYSSTEIVIGLQNYKSQLTMRTYEILASGGFLLTLDTPEIRRLFVPGRDISIAATEEETLSQVRYYLAHPEEREMIRQQGKLAVEVHNYRSRAEYAVKVLDEHGILDHRKLKPSIYHTYLVKEGDTLWGISRQFGIPIERIRKLNDLSTDMIYKNQILRIMNKRRN